MNDSYNEEYKNAIKNYFKVFTNYHDWPPYLSFFNIMLGFANHIFS